MKQTLLTGLFYMMAVGSVLTADFKATGVEQDARLHSDGDGWKLDQARIVDASRPRVLLVGDSILGGYLESVKTELREKAYIDAWINPYCQSENMNKLLGEVLGKGPYDVVHINTGLHGWPKGRIKDGTFEPLTKAMIEVIRAKCPKAKIIWASSTPVTTKSPAPMSLNPEINPNIIEQNRMAAKVMAEMHVPVNDFYSLLVNKLDLARGDQFHWKNEAYPILGKVCAESIKKELPAIVPLPAQVFIVPNFHPASCGWLADFSVERNYCANNYLEHLDRVRDDANYALVVSECNNMVAILNFKPDRFSELKQRIKEGRVEAVNAFFLEPSVSLSGGEALAKMGIEGLRWQEKMLGVRPRSCWAIDTCGVHDQMPQLCALLGLDALVYNRCARSTNSVFWSESPDGTRILTLSIGSYANNLAGLFSETKPLTQRSLQGIVASISGKKPVTPAGAPVLIPGGHGDYSMPPKWQKNPTEFLDAWKQFRPDCEIRFTGLSAYLDALLPLVKPGKIELPCLRAGTSYAYGSFWLNCPRVKAWYRRDEHALQSAEMLATIASLKADYEYPAQPFYHAWLQMLLNMDRNSLWGSAAGMVFESNTSWDMKDRFEWVEKQSVAASTAALRKLAGAGDSVVLFNPLNWQRSDYPQLPSCGTGSAPAPEDQKEIALPEVIETPFCSARIDRTTGALVSLKARPSGREMLGGPANVIVADKQAKGSGNITNPRPKRTRLAGSSDFKTTVTATESPLSIRVEVRGEFLAGGMLKRVIRFFKNNPRIEFETELNDIPDQTVVFAEFPLAQVPEEVRRGIPFGFSRDDNYIQGIVPAVRWVDYASPGKGGVAILDRGLTGREINTNIPIVYLLNAFDKYSGYDSAWTSGKGRHTLEYALVVHDADWSSARIPRLAWEYNCPPVAVTGCVTAKQESFLKTSDNVVVEAMRRDEADIELRLVESVGVAGNAEVTLNLPHESAALTDLVGGHVQKLEGGPAYKFPVKPQQIVTMRFKTKQPVAAVEPLTKWDELVPENKRAALNQHLPDKTGHPPHDVDLYTDQGNQKKK